MELSYLIINVLKKYSSKEKTSETKPLTRKEITKRLQQEYPDEEITEKKVRNALNTIINYEYFFDDSKKSICYKTYGGKNQERHTDYYYNNLISDVELKFLIDSVLYSKIFNDSTAKDLARRIQGLSGKNLKDITNYANDAFGKQRYTLETNVIQNIDIILKASKEEKYIKFQWNVYGVENGKISLRKKGGYRTVKPINLILDNGRYFLLARHLKSEKIYTYSVDLMTKVKILTNVQNDGFKNENIENNFKRAQYILQHPYMMGGEEKKYKIRVQKNYLSRLVDDFSYEIKISPYSETETTVDVIISASRKGILYWLLQHYDIAELVENNDKELEKELSDAVKKLYDKYHKIREI